jgi:hypothetical protein
LDLPWNLTGFGSSKGRKQGQRPEQQGISRSEPSTERSPRLYFCVGMRHEKLNGNRQVHGRVTPTDGDSMVTVDKAERRRG